MALTLYILYLLCREHMIMVFNFRKLHVKLLTMRHGTNFKSTAPFHGKTPGNLDPLDKPVICLKKYFTLIHSFPCPLFLGG